MTASNTVSCSVPPDFRCPSSRETGPGASVHVSDCAVTVEVSASYTQNIAEMARRSPLQALSVFLRRDIKLETRFGGRSVTVQCTNLAAGDSCADRREGTLQSGFGDVPGQALDLNLAGTITQVRAAFNLGLADGAPPPTSFSVSATGTIKWTETETVPDGGGGGGGCEICG